MPHYELIYADGESSIANYADDEEALSAIAACNAKAESGQLIHSSWGPDERPYIQQPVTRVLVFGAHPVDQAPSANTADGLAAVGVADTPPTASNFSVLPERELTLPGSSQEVSE